MDFSADDILEIESLAYRYMLLDEIAIIMGCDDQEIIHNKDAIMALNKGRLKRKAEYNGNVIRLSDQLSSPAMNIEAKISEDTFLRDKLQK